MHTKYERLFREPDEHLAEFVRKGEPEERDTAIGVLWDRHQQKLLAFAASQLRGDFHLAEDVTQRVWLEFEKRVKFEGVKESVQGLLFTIAKRRCIDERRKAKAEWHIENNIPWKRNIEEDVVEWEQREIAAQLPFVASKLSSCERVVWTLRTILEYPVPVVARLLGKSKGNISTVLHNAYGEWKKYRNDYDFELAHQELDRFSSRAAAGKNALIIERFTNSLTPQFTAEELQPLGITVEQYQQLYATSFILPRLHQRDTSDNESGINDACLVIRANYRDDKDLSFHFNFLAELIRELKSTLKPEENDTALREEQLSLIHSCMKSFSLSLFEAVVKVTINGDRNIILTPLFYQCTFPHFNRILHGFPFRNIDDKPHFSPADYISLHSQHMLMPILRLPRIPIDATDTNFLADMFSLEERFRDEFTSDEK